MKAPFLLLALASTALAGEATDLIARSEMHTRGKSFQADATMTVDNAGSTRTMVMRIASVGNQKALVKIMKPVKDRDTGNLRIDLNLWQYLANIERIVKIPPSLMLQSWMGSDFTNDDLVKTSSLARDYEHKLEKHEKIGGLDAAKVICTPRPTAPVVWGKVISWVRAADAVPLKQEFYSENGELLKIMEGSEIKTFGTHTIPTTLTMRNLKKEGSKTTLRYEHVRFDEPIDDKVFTQENLRKPVRD